MRRLFNIYIEKKYRYGCYSYICIHIYDLSDRLIYVIHVDDMHYNDILDIFNTDKLLQFFKKIQIKSHSQMITPHILRFDFDNIYSTLCKAE